MRSFVSETFKILSSVLSYLLLIEIGSVLTTRSWYTRWFDFEHEYLSGIICKIRNSRKIAWCRNKL